MVKGQLTHVIEVFCAAAHGLGEIQHGNTGRVPIAYFGFGELAVLDCHFDQGDPEFDSETVLLPRDQRWVCIRSREARVFRSWPSVPGNGKRLCVDELDDIPQWLGSPAEVTAPPNGAMTARGLIDEPMPGLVAYRSGRRRPRQDAPVVGRTDLGAVVHLGCVRCGLGMRGARPSEREQSDLRRLRAGSRYHASPGRISTSPADDNRTPVPMDALSRVLDVARLAGLADLPLSAIIAP